MLPSSPPGQYHDQQVLGQQLERDVTPKRDLLGLADNAHAALADFADDAKIPELLQSGSRWRGRFLPGFLVIILDLLDFDEGGEDLADVGSQVRIALDVLGQRGAFTAP